MQKKFYITTTLPYVNSDPHIGFAAEIVRADCIARFKRELGYDVFFNTGTDEHGLKIHRKAGENNEETQSYCDRYAQKFNNLKTALNLSYNNFIRTTDKKHQKAAQIFWERCATNGDIYKKNYQIKYCVGCELEKQDSELQNGKCEFHPNQELELIDEENYFFRFSRYEEKLLKFYENNPDFVLPNSKFNEIKQFVKKGLEDFSISRLKTKMPWGVEVPGDSEHVMYVWFDALINYISCLNWPGSDEFSQFWPGMQVAGKDNLRQQTAMWQAMLMSAGIPNSAQVLIFGFINSNGQKMSKSLGNVVNPYDLVEKYGTDALRYYLLADLNVFLDSDFTDEKFLARYNADLANGLGNLVARVANMLEKNKIECELNIIKEGSRMGIFLEKHDFYKKFITEMEKYDFGEALKILWNEFRKCDEILSEKKPWKMEDKEEIKNILAPIAQNILNIAYILKIFLPDTAEAIIKQFSMQQIKKGSPLFPRIT